MHFYLVTIQKVIKLFDIKIACYTAPWGPAGLVDALSTISEFSFDGIECPSSVVTSYEDRLHVFQEILETQGLNIANLLQQIDLLDTENADIQVERAANAARFAAAAGSNTLTVCHEKLRDGELTDEEFATAGAILEEIGERCHEHNIELCYLPRAGRLIGNEKDIIRLMSSTSPDLVKLALDTAEAVLSKTTPQKMIKSTLERIKVIRFRDVSGSKRRSKSTSEDPGSTPQFGRGAVNFDAVCKLLITSGYKGWITLDVTGEAHEPGEAVYHGYRYLMRHSGLFDV